MTTVVGVVGQEVVQQVINALALGSTYALLALGLAMVFSVLGLVNFAHGELVAIAAYALFVANDIGLPFGLQVVVAIAAAALGAIVMQRVVFHPLRGATFITLLISSFALSVLIQNILRAVFSPRQKGITLPDVFNESIKLGGYSIGWLELITLVTCLVALTALALFLKRSTQGLGMLAAAQDFDVTRLMGIASKRVIGLAFAISGALAGAAAIFLVARRGTVEPGMGFAPLLSAFIAVVIGGLGSLSGAILGGFVLAAIEVGLSASLPDGVIPFRDAIALGIVIVILYFRPEGLLTRVEEAR